VSSRPETYSVTLSREFAVVCGMDGTVRWADQRAAHALGIEEGDSLEEFIFADSREKLGWLLIHAGQKKATGWEISFLSHGSPVVYECTGAPYRGDIMLVASMLPANHQAVIDDMTGTMSELSRLQRESMQQQHELEQLSGRLDRERLMLQGVLSQLPSGVRVIDSRTHQVILANDQFYAVLGTEAPDGTSAELAIDAQFPDGRPCEPDQLPIARTLGTGKAISSEDIRLILQDGSNRIIYVSTAPVQDDRGETIAAVEILHDVTELKHLQEKFEHDSLHDALTGLPNRRFFLERLTQAVESTARRGTRLAVLFLDLDGFKQINDALGHHGGDLALSETATRMQSVIRNRDTVARLAGDEFLILLEDVGDASGAITMAERLLSVFAEPLFVGTEQIHLSFSIGIALSDGDERNAEEVIDRADEAMYEAKQMGKNKYHIFKPEQPVA
jgi:diguanylate cyclase (GGDEF)-like protein